MGVAESTFATVRCLEASTSKLSVSDPSEELREQIQQSMVRYADGHRDAFQLLFQQLWPLVQLFSIRALGNAADAEDAAQCALLKIFSRIAEFDRTRDALTWALSIAYYEVLTIRRKTHRRREDHSSLEGMSTTATGESEVIAKHQMIALETSLLMLSEADRDLLLSTIDDDHNSQIAASSVVRKRKQRARVRLREIWRTLYGSF